VSLLVHFVGDNGQSHAGAAGLEGASFLLYLGVTLCVQYYVVHRRALPMWAELGPDAGRPLAVQFMQTPGAFFANFNGPAGWAPGPGPGPASGPGQRQAPGTTAGQGGRSPYADDPNIIDAEVVEDDDDHGPPELHAPR
jgi:hypothetical protein